MLSKSDIKNLIEVFATKAEFHSEISQIREDMVTKGHVNKVMDKLDSVLTEVKDIRQEQQAHYSQHDRIDTRLDFFRNKS
ncbi:MAG: hypothetical protein AAB512_02910 [Patescibacteria group bacterium]